MKRRRYIWARFLFWSLVFLSAAIAFVPQVEHPTWSGLLLLLAAGLAGSNAKQAWQQLEQP